MLCEVFSSLSQNWYVGWLASLFSQLACNTGVIGDACSNPLFSRFKIAVTNTRIESSSKQKLTFHHQLEGGKSHQVVVVLTGVAITNIWYSPHMQSCKEKSGCLWLVESGREEQRWPPISLAVASIVSVCEREPW